MRSLNLIPGALFAVVLSCNPVHAAGSEFNYLHDHPGKTSATVTGTHTALTKSESAEFNRNLERLGALLAKQPALASPRGVEIKGYFRPNDYQPKSKNVPIPGFGFLRFHSYIRDKRTGKAVPFCCPTDEMSVSVNNPEKGPEVCAVPGSPIKVFCAPERVTELAGFPVYRFNGTDSIILQRSKVPVWVPLTREEYVRYWLANWKKQAAESPAIDTITPQIVRNHQAVLDAMTPEERQLQAREFAWNPLQPTLAPVGSGEGRLLMKINPAWFDPKLPRSAFQLVTITFSYSGAVNDNAPGPTEFGDVAPYRVWQALHTSDWREIGGTLAGQ